MLHPCVLIHDAPYDAPLSGKGNMQLGRWFSTMQKSSEVGLPTMDRCSNFLVSLRNDDVESIVSILRSEMEARQILRDRSFYASSIALEDVEDASKFLNASIACIWESKIFNESGTGAIPSCWDIICTRGPDFNASHCEHFQAAVFACKGLILMYHTVRCLLVQQERLDSYNLSDCEISQGIEPFRL